MNYIHDILKSLLKEDKMFLDFSSSFKELDKLLSDNSLFTYTIHETKSPVSLKIAKEGDAKKIKLSLAGVSKEDVSIEACEDGVHVTYKEDGKTNTLIVKEIGLDDEIDAQMENGLLTLTVQRSKKKRKKVEIR